jgi:hypothetical protein
MPLPFRQVYDIYKQNESQLGDMSLQDFSKIANYVTQSKDFSSGDVGPVGGALKKASYYVDNAINWTGAPKVTGAMGEGIFRAFGQNPETGRHIGEAIPRGVLDFAPMIVAGAMSAPVSLPILAGTGALGALNAYGNDASKAGIAASALAPAVGLGVGALARGMAAPALEAAATKFPALANVGIKGATTVEGAATAAEAAASQGLAFGAPVARTTLTGFGDRAALYAAENLGAIAGMEGTQVAFGEKSLSDVVTPENLLGQAVGIAPFALHALPKLLRPQVLSVVPVVTADPKVTPMDPAHIDYANRVLEFDTARKATKTIADPTERKLARIKLNEDFADLLTSKKFAVVSETTKQEVQQVAKTDAPNLQNHILDRLTLIEKTLNDFNKTNKELLDAGKPEVEPNELIDSSLGELNAMTTKPITVAESSKLVEELVNTGSTEQEAAHAVVQTGINNVLDHPVVPEVHPMDKAVGFDSRTPEGTPVGAPPKEVPKRPGPLAKTPEALKAQQNNKGSRPKKDFTEDNIKFNDYLNKDPEGEEVAKVISEIYPKIDQIRGGIPDEHQTDVSRKLFNSIEGWKKNPELIGKPLEERLAALKPFLRNAIRQARTGTPIKELHPLGPDGKMISYGSNASARTAADALQAKADADPQSIAFYNVVSVGTKEKPRYVVKAFEDLSKKNVSMDASKDAADMAAQQTAVDFELGNTQLMNDGPAEVVDTPEILQKDLQDAIGGVTTLKQFLGALKGAPEGLLDLKAAFPADKPIVPEEVKQWMVDNVVAKLPPADARVFINQVTGEVTKAKMAESEKAKPSLISKTQQATEKLKAIRVSEALDTATKKTGQVDADRSAEMVQDQYFSLLDSVENTLELVDLIKQNKPLYVKFLDYFDGGIPDLGELTGWMKDGYENSKPGSMFKTITGNVIKKYAPETYRTTLAGSGAVGAPLTLLQKALGMAGGRNTLLELSYPLREKIWKETGWNPLMDGQWRFEINDLPAKLLKIRTSLQTEFGADPMKVIKLRDILDHPELYKHYPELANYRVIYDPKVQDGSLGFHEGSTNSIGLTSRGLMLEKAELKLLFLHEVQHAIQKFEGFAPGGEKLDIRVDNETYQRTLKRELEAGRAPADAESRALFAGYKAIHGEMEAGIVEQRARLLKTRVGPDGQPRYEGKDVPPYESAALHPYDNRSVPLKDWTILPGDGTSYSMKPTVQEPFQFGMKGVTERVLSRIGWSKKQINDVAHPFMAKLEKVLNFNGIEFGVIAKGTEIGGRELLGAASVTGKVRKLFLAASTSGKGRSLEEQIVGFGLNTAHEVGHHIEQAAVNGLLSPEATAARDGWRNWSTSQAPTEWSRVLKEFGETLPKEWQNLTELKDMMNPANVAEFEASAHAIWAMGHVAKSSDLMLFSSLMPKPVRTWFATIGKWGRDLMGAAKSFLHLDQHTGTKENRADVDRLVNYFESIKHSVNDANLKMAEFASLAGLDSHSMSYLNGEGLTEIAPSVLEASDGVMRTQLSGVVPKTMKDKVFDGANRSLVYLDQLAGKYPKISNAAYAVMGAGWNKKMVTYEAMSPLYGKQDLGSGKLVIDPAKKPLLELVSSYGRANKAANEIHLWENKNKLEFPLAKPGTASNRLATRLAQLTPTERQAVEMWHEGKKLSHQKLNEHIIEGKLDETKLIISNVLATMTGHIPGKHAQLEQAVDLAMRSANEQLPGVKQNMIATWSQMLATGDALLDSQLQQTLFDLSNTAVESMTRLQGTLASRPWYTPEIRTGSHLLRAFGANGQEVFTLGYNTSAELAELTAMGRAQGATDFSSSVRERGLDVKFDEVFKSNIEHFETTMTRKLRDALPASMQHQAEDLVNYMNIESEFQRLAQANKLNPTVGTRRLAPGREQLNIVSGWQQYINMMSNVLSNGRAQARMKFEFNSPELNDPVYAGKIQQIKDTFKNYQTPDSEMSKRISQINAVYHLGFNIPTHLAELSQSLSTMLPELVFQAGSTTKGVKMLMQTAGEMAKFYSKKTVGKLIGKDEWHNWGNKQEELVLEEMARRGLLAQHAFMEHLDGDNVGNNLSIVSAGQRSPLDMLKQAAVTPFKAYSDVSMNVYGSFTKFNTRMATILGYRLAKAQGKSHEAALEDTARFITKTTFTSGRAGRPPEFYNNSTVGAVLYSLQRYSLSWMSMYGKHLSGAFGDQARMTELGQGLKGNHRKALATMTAVQFGLAGALGLPFAAALTTILEQSLGIDIRGKAYNALSSLMQEDEEEDGGMFADLVMRGGVNALAERAGAPVDFGSRFNLSGLPGMNEFNGFDPGRVFGPTVNVANAMFSGVKGLATGELPALAKTVMPVGLRKASEYFINGDALTSKGTKFGLSSNEGALYAAGFTPNRVRKTRDAEAILRTQSEARQKRDQQAADAVAELVQSNPDEARRRYAEHLQTTGTEPRDFAKSVADAHLKANYPKDIRTTIAEPDAKMASQTLKSMNVVMPQSTQGEQANAYNTMLQFFNQRPIMSRQREAQRRDSLAAWDPYQAF